MAAMMGFSADRIEDLKTAVAEACINAIEHGNQLNSSLNVGVVLSTSGDELEVKAMDDGVGIGGAPASPDIDRKMLGEEDPCGMGMFLIQALVDEAAKIGVFGLSADFHKVFTMAGIPKYASLYVDEKAALASA